MRTDGARFAAARGSTRGEETPRRTAFVRLLRKRAAYAQAEFSGLARPGPKAKFVRRASENPGANCAWPFRAKQSRTKLLPTGSVAERSGAGAGR